MEQAGDKTLVIVQLKVLLLSKSDIPILYNSPEKWLSRALYGLHLSKFQNTTYQALFFS